MNIQTLPTYSAERFFLLSEIEQKSTFHLIDDMNNQANLSIALKNPLTILYTKWRPLIQDEMYLYNKIRRLLQPILLDDTSTTYIIVDGYISNKDDWDNEVLHEKLKIVFSMLHQQTGIQNIVIGVTDNLGGLPGLEKCYDLIEKVAPGYSSFPIICDFVSENREDMMGHDPILEPDAKSGVFQVLCSSQEDAWEKEVIARVSKRAIMINSKQSTTIQDNVYFQRCAEIVGCLTALLLSLYFAGIYLNR